MKPEKKIEDKKRMCIWKIAAENDNKKKGLGIGPITLSKDKPCYECSGYNETNCKAYHPSKDNLNKYV